MNPYALRAAPVRAVLFGSALLGLSACADPLDTDPLDTDPSGTGPEDTDVADTDLPPGSWDGQGPWPDGVDPFADRVVDYAPGEFAGFGQERFPDVVLGGPRGGGANAGGLDVLSLGLEGTITLALDDWVAVDGPGPDLIVFENPFPGWVEPGRVEVSADGETWVAFDCDGLADGAPGCAGVEPVLAHVDERPLDPTDPEVAGGDAFDLADVGLAEARFVRITDDGTAPDFGYAGTSGGFDLDAVAVVNGARP